MRKGAGTDVGLYEKTMYLLSLVQSDDKHEWYDLHTNQWVTPNYHADNVNLGGSIFEWPDERDDPRSHLSFWGTNDADSGTYRVGGCCHDAYDGPEGWHWGFEYEVYFVLMEFGTFIDTQK